MCNLYSLTNGQAAIRDWFRARHDHTGNLPLFPGIFPDQFAPIVRNGTVGELELVMARWGMPGPPQSIDASVRDLRILDVEPIVPVEPEATLVLDRLAPVLSSASGAAAVDEAFAVGLISTPTASKLQAQGRPFRSIAAIPQYRVCSTPCR
jgi:hypothetical protein